MLRAGAPGALALSGPGKGLSKEAQKGRPRPEWARQRRVNITPPLTESDRSAYMFY